MALVDFDDLFEPVNSNLITIEDCLRAGSKGVFISNEHYHALDGISGSNLPLLAISNKHLDEKHLFSLASAPPLVRGTLYHTLVLEPDSVFDRYVVMPSKFLGKAYGGKTIIEQKKEFHAANNNKIIIEHDEFLNAERMARNTKAIYGDLVDAGIKERSLFVKIRGVVCKCRLDIDIERLGDDIDLKSITIGTKKFNEQTLRRHIEDLNYQWSAAFRNLIRRELGLPVRDSFLIFCDTGNGNMVRKIQIDPEKIAEAESLVNDLIESRKLYQDYQLDNRPVPVIG